MQEDIKPSPFVSLQGPGNVLQQSRHPRLKTFQNYMDTYFTCFLSPLELIDVIPWSILFHREEKEPAFIATNLKMSSCSSETLVTLQGLLGKMLTSRNSVREAGWDGIELQEGGKVGEKFLCEEGHKPCLGDKCQAHMTTPYRFKAEQNGKILFVLFQHSCMTLRTWVYVGGIAILSDVGH